MRGNLHLVAIFFVFIGLLVFGTFAYSNLEGWNYLDSSYFSFVTITTIGYGDLSPQTPAGKIFTMFFAFFGISLVFYLLSVLGAKMFKKHVSQRISEMKHEVKGEEKVLKKVEDTVKKKRSRSRSSKTLSSRRKKKS